MNRKLLDFWVGLFAAIGLAALFFLALQVSNLKGGKPDAIYQLTAEFDNIGGLKVKAPVKSAGVVVGRVADISFDNKRYVAVVSLDMDQRYQFDRETSAEILTSGILGEQYIGLTAGADETMLKQGEKIKQTSSAMVLEQLIGKFLMGKSTDAKPEGN